MNIDDRLRQARDNYRALAPPGAATFEPRSRASDYTAPDSADQTEAYVAATADSFDRMGRRDERAALARSRRQLQVVLVVILVPILAIGVIAGRHGGEGSNTADGTTTSTSDQSPSTTARPNVQLPDVVPPLGPTDGKASARLPVQVRPDKGLVDGQMVSVTGLGFRPNTSVGAVMCTNAATTEGAVGCDIGNVINIVDSDAEGVATLQYEIRRYIHVGGQTVDCQTGNVDPDDYARLVREQGPKPATPVNPASFTCVIAMGEVNDYDHSGGWPIAFAGSVFLMPTTTVAGATTTVPTTVVLTTASSTTVAPTAMSTTVAPTTARSTTVAPTTAAALGTTSIAR